MPKVPFSSQILPIDYLSSAQADIKAGKPVSGKALLAAIEQNTQQQLPDAVREIVSRALIPAVKTRGRPKKFDASLDIALDRVNTRYPALLRYEQRSKDRGKGISKGDSSPSKLAYERLLRHMKHDFGPITWEALRNMHSTWSKGRFHAPDNQIDSDDFDDAEIERRFPASRNDHNN
jgi:hypothetical protein